MAAPGLYGLGRKARASAARGAGAQNAWLPRPAPSAGRKAGAAVLLAAARFGQAPAAGFSGPGRGEQTASAQSAPGMQIILHALSWGNLRTECARVGGEE